MIRRPPRSTLTDTLFPLHDALPIFLMVEYVGIPYVDVVKHAFLPAVISYIALLYLVHLEAMKADMPVLPKPGGRKPLPMTLLTSGITIASILILCGLVYYAVTAFQALFGAASG